MSTDPAALQAGADAPAVLLEAARQGLARYLDRCGDDAPWLANHLADPGFARDFARVWGGSPFVVDSCIARPGLFRDLVDSGDLDHAYGEAGHRQRLAVALADAASEADLRQGARGRSVWRDFTRRAATLDPTIDMARLAEAGIQGAIDQLHPALCAELGTPIGKHSGREQGLVVLGMGKMGAFELNVSSDIDLIFAFPEAGETVGGRRQQSNQEFFTKLGQKLIQALDNKTADGFVFRVDMRLRPYGQSGALVLNFDALEDYYHTQGRDWERYAMIKARVVAGGRDAGQRLMAILRPFTYRKYIDFSAIQSLRDMKAMINREVQRLGTAADIKKGAGGIRQVEFIAQSFQLIRGGKHARFQNPELRAVLGLLDAECLVPAGAGDEVRRGYVFLRYVEPFLQGHREQLSPLLSEADRHRVGVAAVLGYPDCAAFAAVLDRHRALMHRIFAVI